MAAKIDVYNSTRADIERYINKLKRKICCSCRTIPVTLVNSENLGEFVPPCHIIIRLQLNGMTIVPLSTLGNGSTTWEDYLVDINAHFLNTGFTFSIVNDNLVATNPAVNITDTWILFVKIICE